MFISGLKQAINRLPIIMCSSGTLTRMTLKLTPMRLRGNKDLDSCLRRNDEMSLTPSDKAFGNCFSNTIAGEAFVRRSRNCLAGPQSFVYCFIKTLAKTSRSTFPPDNTTATLLPEIDSRS
jgi:hypothetical protein